MVEGLKVSKDKESTTRVNEAGLSITMSIEWSKVRYECLTRPMGSKRAEPHTNDRHRDGCLAHYPCGCVQRYYSSYYYSRSGFRFYSPNRTLLTAQQDGLCPIHFKRRLDNIYGGRKR